MATIEKLVLSAVTNKKDSAGTNAHIYVAFNGGRLIWVPADEKNFDKGCNDRIEWDVTRFAIDYDGVNKVEIFNDSSGEGPGWLIDSIQLDAVVGGQTRPLTQNASFGWLDKTEKEGDRRQLQLRK